MEEMQAADMFSMARDFSQLAQEKQRSTITVINETWDRSTARMERFESAGMAVQMN